MENVYVTSFSIQGLQELIEENQQLLTEKKKEYQDVCDGKRYNPLCKESWKKTISAEISEIEETIKELEEALEHKKALV